METENNNVIATQKEITETEIFAKIKESQKNIFDHEQPKEEIPTGTDKESNAGQTEQAGNTGQSEPITEPKSGFTGEVIKTDEPAKPTGILGLLNPEMAVNLLDIAMCRLSVIGARKFDIEATKQDFKLDAQEKATVKPLLEASLKELKWQSNNPHVNLGIALCLVYGLKIADLADRKKEVSQDEITDRMQRIADNLKTEVDKNLVTVKGTPRKNKPGAGRPRKNK